MGTARPPGPELAPGTARGVAQEVEVRFTPDGSGTSVDLEHRGWARLGADAAEARRSYEGGWRAVLGTHFAQACQRDGRPSAIRMPSDRR